MADDTHVLHITYSKANDTLNIEVIRPNGIAPVGGDQPLIAMPTVNSLVEIHPLIEELSISAFSPGTPLPAQIPDDVSVVQSSVMPVDTQKIIDTIKLNAQGAGLSPLNYAFSVMGTMIDSFDKASTDPAAMIDELTFLATNMFNRLSNHGIDWGSIIASLNPISLSVALSKNVTVNTSDNGNLKSVQATSALQQSGYIKIEGFSIAEFPIAGISLDVNPNPSGSGGGN